MLKSTAAVLSQLNHPLDIREITIPPELLPGQVLVKVWATAICGSQIGEIKGIKGPDRFLPHLLGHEAVVEILECGEATNLKKGDFALAHWMKGPGKSGGPVKYLFEGSTINAGEIATFSQYAVISENRTTKISEELLEQFGFNFLSTVGCSFLTAYGTIINDVTPNNLDNVLLIGGGGISQALVVVLRCLGIENIEVVEPNLERRNYLKSIGTKVTYPSTSDIPHSSRFFSAVIEMTGLTKEIEFGYESLVQNGTIALIGVTKENEKILIDPMPLHYGKKIVGVYGGGVKPDKDIFALLDLIKRGGSILSKIQYKELSINQINQGIEAMTNTTFPGRVIIKIS